jgi:hypothetical protein
VRWLALLVALVVLAEPAAAREVSATIVEYGLYTAEVVGQQREASGIVTDLLDKLCHVATTPTVPLQSHLHFGFRFRIDGPMPGEPVELTFAVTFPEAAHPPAGLPLRRHQHSGLRETGTVSYTGYSLDQEWEFVPGDWTLEVLQGERRLAGMSFTVVDGDRPALSSPDPSSCFRVSSL